MRIPPYPVSSHAAAPGSSEAAGRPRAVQFWSCHGLGGLGICPSARRWRSGMEAPAVPASLWEVFAALPDPRDPRGRRHPLPALLSLTAVALLAGMRGLEAIAQFARDHGLPLRLALGFTRLDSPCKATLSNLFRALDIDAYERAL